VLFCFAELRTERPLMNLRVFRIGRVNAVILSFLIIQVVYCGLLYLLPFYLTSILEADSMMSGLYLLIPPAVTAAVSVPFGRWSDRTGRRWFCTAACIVLLVISIMYALITPAWGLIPLLFALFLMGMGIGIASGPASGRIVEEMPESDREMGSSLMITCVYFGGVVGTALYAAVFTLLTEQNGVILSFAELEKSLFLSGFHMTMAAGAVICVLAVILAVIVKDPARR
ncbi:MAG: MFS transporter, partial [Methanocorpusculum sp.]|nr:MFS transporter [Methanocorpusculum sp.]